MNTLAGSMTSVTASSPIKLVIERRHIEKEARPVPAIFNHNQPNTK
jgi:hypothetical protein